jgi:hypothetical protein
MLSPYVYFTLALVPLAAVLLVAARRSQPKTTHTDRLHAFQTHALNVPAHLQLWAVIVLLSAIEALALRLADRSVLGPVYVGANFFAVCVLLLAVPVAHTGPAPPFLHLFAHVACALYFRATSWLFFTGSAS